ncbi:hypothetical protein YC2023_122269 [Brassica napus]
MNKEHRAAKTTTPHDISARLEGMDDRKLSVDVMAVRRPTLRRPHKMPNKRCKVQFKTSRDEADQRRRFLQFDVQEFCDNFEKQMLKTLRTPARSKRRSQPHIHQ